MRFLFVIAFVLFLTTVAIFSSPAALRAQEPVTPPASTPDAEDGLALFAERCANCHGPMGAGDGEMSAQLPLPPASLSDEAFIRQAVPAEMFHVITNGIPEAAMPPFGEGNSDPLSDQQRWNLVAAIYSLGTSQEVIDQGQTVYEENCVACHAADGSGVDGVLDLGGPNYWIERSDEAIVETLIQDDIPEHEELTIDDEALQAVTAYARTFSYTYANPLAAFEPIESALISGLVTNETTGEPLGEGVPAVLSAFTADFQPSITLTTTLDSAGQYAFDLTMTPPDLVYVVTVLHEGISYGSDFGQLERSDPTLTLDVPVYDRSTDASTISVDQLHVIVQFGEGLVQVSELYQFSQNASVVFVGESGDPTQGTARISLPPGASDPSFDRSFGGMESFFPADSVIAVDGGWADTVPLRPGTGSLSLLVRYTLPYEDALAISHPVHYPVDSVNLVLPDAGVEVTAEDWQDAGIQMMGEAGAFLNYNRANVAAGEEVSFALRGEPRQVTSSTPAATRPRNESSELLIGGGVLLLALALGAFTVRQWRQNRAVDDDFETFDAGEVEEATVIRDERGAEQGEDAINVRREALLQEIAALDDAYEAGDVEEAAYQERRAALKDELIAIWNR